MEHEGLYFYSQKIAFLKRPTRTT